MAYALEGLEYLAGSIAMLAIWAALYALRKETRREMLFAGVITAPLGILEPLFVPSYWNPPTILGLYSKIGIGFDVESIIFCFAVGGISAAIYELVFPGRHIKISKKERRAHRFHYLALFAGPIALVPLAAFSGWNIIYSAVAAMALAGVAAMLCRPDLKRKILLGGALFLAFYFIFFLAFDAAFAGYVQKVWNLKALSGILVFGIPLEELLYALTQGLMWSSIYEHLNWYRLGK